MFAEMALGKPLFEGDSEIDMLYRIFNVCGTPWNKRTKGHSSSPSQSRQASSGSEGVSTEETYWEEVDALPHFSATFPQWKRANFAELFPQLPPDGIDLLEV